MEKTNSIEEAYSSDPWWYDLRGVMILKFAYRGSLFGQINFFARNIGKKHLEVAIGSGSLFQYIYYFAKLIGRPISQIDGFDYASRMIAGAKKRFSNYPHMNLFLADAADTKLASETYDTINIVNALHCLPEIEKSLIEMHRLLLPQGTLAGNCLLYPKGSSLMDKIANNINEWGAKKGILQRPYHVKELQKYLADAGFRIIKENSYGNCYDFVAQKK